MRFIVALFMTMAAAASAIAASGGPPVDIETRGKGAGRVVVASVSDVFSTFGTNSHGDQLIVSHVQLQVEEVMKGARESVLDLTIEGGTVGDVTMRVSDMPVLRRGERGVFFLDGDTPRDLHAHRRGLGILKLDENNRVPGSTLTLPDVRDLVRRSLSSARGGR